MTDPNRSFLRFLKPTKNGHSPNGAADLPSDWPDFLTSVEMRERLADVEKQEVDLQDHKVDLRLKVLDGGLRALVVLTIVGGEIVLLMTHPAFFFLNSLAFPGLAYRWWKAGKKPPDEHGGDP